MELRWALWGPLPPAADAYIEQHPHATYSHARAWRDAVWKTYHLPHPTLMAFEAGRIVGVAPWTLMLNPLVGPYLVIGPFSSLGDLLFDPDRLDVAEALLAETVRWGKRLGIRYAQIRSAHPLPALGALAATVSKKRFVCPRVDVRDGAQAAWDRFETRGRNAARKAEKAGVVVRAVDDWAPFMAVVDDGCRRLGSPFHGRAYFEALARNLGPDGRAWIAWAGDRPAAIATALVRNDTYFYLYGQNVADLRSTAANAALVWHMIQDAARAGLSWVDLGRSEADSPQETFKLQWGPQPALDIQDLLIPIGARRLPDLTPTNESFGRAQQVWSKLPLWMTRRLGPLLIRGFG